MPNQPEVTESLMRTWIADILGREPDKETVAHGLGIVDEAVQTVLRRHQDSASIDSNPATTPKQSDQPPPTR